MKNLKYILVITLFISALSFSQVGIGTALPDAILDISASDENNPSNIDGVLIPRVDNFTSVNPTLNQDSLLIFVTGNGAVARGFYYWDNTITAWVMLGSDAISNLSLTRVTLSANQTLNGTGWQKINFNSVDFDINSEFDIANNRFVAQTNGYYRINASFHTLTAEENTNFYGIEWLAAGLLLQFKIMFRYLPSFLQSCRAQAL